MSQAQNEGIGNAHHYRVIVVCTEISVRFSASARTR